MAGALLQERFFDILSFLTLLRDTKLFYCLVVVHFLNLSLISLLGTHYIVKFKSGGEGAGERGDSIIAINRRE